MGLIKSKFVRIFSDGSLNVSYKYYANTKKVSILEKDNKNSYLNRKKVASNVPIESSSNYRKGILNKY